MKRILAMLLSIAIFCGCAVVYAAEHKNRIYYIGGDENFPPYEYLIEVEGQKVYRGFNVDVMKAVALETGIEIEFRPMTWAKVLQELEDGEIDIVQGIKYDVRRIEQYDFSDEYLTTAQAIFVRNDSYINELDDLRGQKIAVQDGDIAHQQLKNNKAYGLIALPNQADAFAMLINGEVDAVICNKMAGYNILQQTENIRRIKVVGDPIAVERYGAAVKKGNTELLAIINKGLDGIKKNGIYDKIYIKWFGEQLDYSSAYYRQRLAVALSVLGACVFALLLLIYVSYILRREVAKRTMQIASINSMLLEKNEYIRRESLYREKILNSSYNGIITVDQYGIIGFANEYARECFPNEEFNAVHFSKTSMANFLSPELFNTVLQERAEKRFDGRDWEYIASVFCHEEEVESILLTFRDITLDKQLKDRLSRKDKMESLGNLVANIAHEIRTPLTSIKTFAELIDEKYDNESFRNTFKQYVPQEVERLNMIVNDLLDYARPRRPFFTAVRIGVLVRNILPLFSGQIEKINMSLAIDIADELQVYADKQHVQQVLINLILNALEAQNYSNAGKIVITGKEEQSTVLLIVEDNGNGIDMGSMDNIFDPFFTTKSNGTGLGLAISYQLIKENNGEIWAENSISGGARLCLRLPGYKGGKNG